MSAPCGRPIDLAALESYWLEDGDPKDLDAIEEHLLACDACSGRLRGLVALGDGIRRLAQEGTVEVVVTPSYLAKAGREGLRTREYRVVPGGRVDCTVTAEDDLLVSRLVGDFKGVSRLDVVAEQAGLPTRRIQDVPISPEAGELIVAQAMPYMRALQHARLRIRLVSQEAGGERLIGEYTFDHSPAPSSH
jgi:hypothetical protein